MNELEKLVKQLQNLQKAKSTSVTLDINYLLGILSTMTTVQPVKQVTPIEIYRKVDVDGGGFKDGS